MASANVNVKVEVADSHTVQAALKTLYHGANSRALWCLLSGMALVDITIAAGISALWVELPLIGIVFYRVGVVTPRFNKQLEADEAAHELRTETED